MTPFQIIGAVVVVVAATVAGVTHTVSGDALLGVYGTALGYIFGIGHEAIRQTLKKEN